MGSDEAQSASEQASRDQLLAEFEFIREGMRQDQRERLVFLGFVVAASSAILGLLARDARDLHSSNQAFVLVGIALSIVIVAELLTIRATVGVASAGHYLREFIEPRTAELRFQTRNPLFLDRLRGGSTRPFGRGLMRASVSASSGLAVAYGALTLVLLIAWFTVDLSTSRGIWRSAALVAAACVSASLIGQLWWTAKQGARHVGDAWRAVKTDECSSSRQSGRAET